MICSDIEANVLFANFVSRKKAKIVCNNDLVHVNDVVNDNNDVIMCLLICKIMIMLLMIQKFVSVDNYVVNDEDFVNGGIKSGHMSGSGIETIVCPGCLKRDLIIILVSILIGCKGTSL